jgi:viroplasmin and RNaseH domain-containing protein
MPVRVASNRTGVFESWDEVKASTSGGYHRPKFKRFRTRSAAEKWCVYRLMCTLNSRWSQ